MLITDWNTEHIILHKNNNEISSEIQKYKDDSIHLINDLDLDVWIRDYSYLEKINGDFIAFNFWPTYLPKYMANSIQDTFEKYVSYIKRINLRIDMGNFIHNGKMAIMTDKVLKLNKHLEKSVIERILIEEFELENIYFVPSIPGEKTGHIDGMAQFINENCILIDSEALEYCQSLTKIPNVSIEILESKKDHSEYINGWQSAIGLYVNFLQTKNAIYFPIFKQSDDDKMIKLFEQFKKKINIVDCSTISKHGGGLHCITWNIKNVSTIKGLG